MIINIKIPKRQVEGYESSVWNHLLKCLKGLCFDWQNIVSKNLLSILFPSK